MTRDEFLQAAIACAESLGDHHRRTPKQRLQEIADSPYAEHARDHYGSGGFVTVLEAEIAELFGKEAAVVMPSGTMAQQIALRIWADRAGNRTVAFHPTCHLEKHEHMAYRELHGLEAILLGESDRLFTLAELEATKSYSSLLVELPQREIGGQLPSWEELSAILSLAHKSGAKTHVDGARLWECQPFYAKPYREIVADFDSVYVSFYKVLGGLPGAALAGPADFIAEARIWMRRHGGNLANMFPIAISAKAGMDSKLPRISKYVAKASEVARLLNALPGIRTVPVEPPTNMMHVYFDASAAAMMDAVGDVAAREKCLLFSWFAEAPSGCRTELWIGDAGLDLSTERVGKLLSQMRIVP